MLKGTMAQSFVSSLIAGAIAGSIATIMILQSPIATERLRTNQTTSTQSLPPSADVSAHERAVIQTVQAAQPAVVSIIVTKDVPIVEQYFEEVPGFFNNPFGSPFNFQIPRLRERGTQEQQIGGGSGFLISSDGMIVTNRHVVNDEEAAYTVFLNDGNKYDAEVVAIDPTNDVAIVKIEGNNFPFLEFANSEQLQVGQTVIAIGNALGEFQNTVSTGVVSGLARSIIAGNELGQAEQLDEVIQTDAAINPGNSGGPLLDLTGKVVGVNVAVALGSENIGFALPSNVVKAASDSVKETGRIIRPYIGVRYIPINAEIQQTNNLSVDYGVLVVRGENAEQLAVVPGSPANKAGIVEGDIILEMDGQRITEETSLAQMLRDKKVGDQVRLKVLSAGQEKEVTVTLEDYPQ